MLTHPKEVEDVVIKRVMEPYEGDRALGDAPGQDRNGCRGE